MKTKSLERMWQRASRSYSCIFVTLFVAVFILAPYRSLSDDLQGRPLYSSNTTETSFGVRDGSSIILQQPKTSSEKPVFERGGFEQPDPVSADGLTQAVNNAGRGDEKSHEPNNIGREMDRDDDNSDESVAHEYNPDAPRQFDTGPSNVNPEMNSTNPDSILDTLSGQVNPNDLSGRGRGALDETPLNTKCFKHIVYDKPIKTGSTAVTKALKKYLQENGNGYLSCIWDPCTDAAMDVCSGKRERVNLIDHIRGKEGMLECLGRKGYYRVTSIRHPLQRWESSYLFNQKKNGTHYGIHHDESYSHFMNNYPACALHHYYDNLGKHCGSSAVNPEERTRRIVARYDEVIDLYNDDMIGPLHRRLQGLLRQENKSPRPDTDFRESFLKSRMAHELILYNALKKKQKETFSKRDVLCL